MVKQQEPGTVGIIDNAHWEPLC